MFTLSCEVAPAALRIMESPEPFPRRAARANLVKFISGNQIITVLFILFITIHQVPLSAKFARSACVVTQFVVEYMVTAEKGSPIL